MGTRNDQIQTSKEISRTLTCSTGPSDILQNRRESPIDFTDKTVTRIIGQHHGLGHWEAEVPRQFSLFAAYAWVRYCGHHVEPLQQSMCVHVYDLSMVSSLTLTISKF